VSELELGVELHGGRAVVVTGSNGKSTTVSLIHHILTRSGQPAFLCGNVGTPVIASEEILAPSSVTRSTLVVEASSYQLESCTVLHPEVSVFLNITDNHLERHGSIERYAAAKSRALRLQSTGDIGIFNGDDPIVRRMAQKCSASAVYFGRRETHEMEKLSHRWAAIQYLPGEKSTVDVQWEQGVEQYDLTNISLLGLHNRYNVAASILAARALGVTQQDIQAALPSFRPLLHRLELVIDAEGTTVINDSKSTTVAATVAAYSTVKESYPGRPVILMIGGLSKAGSWEPLLSMIDPKDTEVPPVLCFGKDAPLLSSHCRAKGISHAVYATLRDATTFAMRPPYDDGRVVLLSPGCASFDEFADFEERGIEFKRFVAELSARPEPMQ
jgi:UDP-N-acetylmuramoylalanine--D-glutamate ligase